LPRERVVSRQHGILVLVEHGWGIAHPARIANDFLIR
jgi:hypothetical protein